MSESNEQNTAAEVEAGVNAVAGVAAALDPALGKPAVAALQGAEAVANTVLATHAGTLQQVAAGLGAAVAAAPAVAAAVSPEAAAKVTAIQTKATGLLAEIEAFLASIGL